MTTDLATAFRAARLPAATVHLDSAACGRSSIAVLDAVAAHARHESELGGYVAEAAAAPAIDAARAGLGALMGFGADDIAFVESAASALAILLSSWPLPAGSAVGVLRDEYGPNLGAFEDFGLEVVELPTDATGHLDLTAFPAALDGVSMVHLTQVGSYRGLVQPVAEAAALAEQAGVPCVVDQAQALGHVDTVTRATAAYSTSRKWLCGPRGVGILATRPALAERLVPRAPALPDRWWPGSAVPMRRYESAEAHVAGRVGLAVAVTEHLAHGPANVHAGLAEVGRRTRHALSELPGWTVIEPDDEPTAMTTLQPPPDIDVLRLRSDLIAAGFVTTYDGVARAPRVMTRPALRLSPHLDVTDGELEALAARIVGPWG